MDGSCAHNSQLLPQHSLQPQQQWRRRGVGLPRAWRRLGSRRGSRTQSQHNELCSKDLQQSPDYECLMKLFFKVGPIGQIGRINCRVFSVALSQHFLSLFCSQGMHQHGCSGCTNPQIFGTSPFALADFEAFSTRYVPRALSSIEQTAPADLNF